MRIHSDHTQRDDGYVADVTVQGAQLGVLWTVTMPEGHNKGRGLIFVLAATRREAWESACDRLYVDNAPRDKAYYDTCISRLRLDGYRAAKVCVVLGRKTLQKSVVPSKTLKVGDMVVTRSGQVGMLVAIDIGACTVKFGADGPFQLWGRKALRQATTIEVREAGLEFVGGNSYRGK
jgi:hypothetical protein